MRDLFEEIWSTLRQNKLRTALTGFAVAWGIFLLIVLLGAGNGVINALVGNMGTLEHFMSVTGMRTSKPYAGYEKGRRIRFDQRDVRTLESDEFSSTVEKISPVVTQSATVVYGDQSSTLTLKGATQAYMDIQKVTILYGRLLNDSDDINLRKSVLIGNKDAEFFAGKGRTAKDMLGKDIKIGLFVWRVVGIYKANESSESSEIYAPFSTVSTIYNSGTKIPEIYFSFNGLETEEENDAFVKKYRTTVNINHDADPDDDKSVRMYNSFTSAQQLSKVLGILRTALWILGLFSLLSGIVGVSNIMLITVKERTHEFGIRKAIGAKPMSILTLIITESIVITAVFGYIGMVAGMLTNEFMGAAFGDRAMDVGVAQITMFVNPGVGLDVAIKATLVLIIAGTIAGLMPAWKASEVKPIEALRSE